MMRRLAVFVGAGGLCLAIALAQQTGPPTNPIPHSSEESKAKVVAEIPVTNPTYSGEVRLHRDPRALLAEYEAKAVREPTPSMVALAGKAALEAGENQKAREYALRALAKAGEEAALRDKRGLVDPLGDRGVNFYANFVLGRLAILDGDIRLAEQYLIASGKTSGNAPLNSYGPNLSLALELLKRGDAQSRKAVLQFIDEIKVFWAIKPAHFEKWSADIAAGKMPDFLAVGGNLFY